MTERSFYVEKTLQNCVQPSGFARFIPACPIGVFNQDYSKSGNSEGSFYCLSVGWCSDLGRDRGFVRPERDIDGRVTFAAFDPGTDAYSDAYSDADPDADSETDPDAAADTDPWSPD